MMTLILSVLLPLVFSLAVPQNRGEVVFVHMSDPQIGFMDESEHYALSDSLLGNAVAAINRIKQTCS